MNKKRIITITIILILSLIITGIVFVFAAKNRHMDFPRGGLSAIRGQTSYTPSVGLGDNVVMENLLLDVPSSKVGVFYSGNAYQLSDEVSLFVTPMFSGIDANKIADILKENLVVDICELKHFEEGFLNGYACNYNCFKTEHSAILCYTIITGGENNIVLGGIVKDTAQNQEGSLNVASNALKSIIGTIRDYEVFKKQLQPTIEPDKEHEGDVLDKDMSYDNYDVFISENAPVKKEVTQQYDYKVFADNDYDRMRLTLMLLDVSVVPREIHLYNKDKTLEYEPISAEYGTYVYLIDNVSNKEKFIFYFDMKNPRGISIQMEEESEYEDYYENRVVYE